MDAARRDFLARTGRTLDQYARTGWRNTFDLRANGGDRRGVAGEVGLRAGAQPKLGILPGQGCGFQGASDDMQQPIGFEWLFDKVVGTVLDRLDGHFDRAVPGDHHHRDLRFFPMEGGEDAEAVHARPLQPHVQNRQRRAADAEGGDRRVGIGGLAGFVSLVAQNAVDQQADVRFVVYNQNIKRHRPSLRAMSV